MKVLLEIDMAYPEDNKYITEEFVKDSLQHEIDDLHLAGAMIRMSPILTIERTRDDEMLSNILRGKCPTDEDHLHHLQYVEATRDGFRVTGHCEDCAQAWVLEVSVGAFELRVSADD